MSMPVLLPLRLASRARTVCALLRTCWSQLGERGCGQDGRNDEKRWPACNEPLPGSLAVLSLRAGSALAAFAPPGAAQRDQEGERDQDSRQQRRLVDAGDGVALVAAQADPVRATGGAAGT